MKYENASLFGKSLKGLGKSDKNNVVKEIENEMKTFRERIGTILLKYRKIINMKDIDDIMMKTNFNELEEFKKAIFTNEDKKGV